MRDLAKEEIDVFWEFVKDHIEDMVVEPRERENDTYIWMSFDILKDFNDVYQGLCEENGFVVELMMGAIHTKASDLLYGYGIKNYLDVWKKRPKGIERRKDWGRNMY